MSSTASVRPATTRSRSSRVRASSALGKLLNPTISSAPKSTSSVEKPQHRSVVSPDSPTYAKYGRRFRNVYRIGFPALGSDVYPVL